VPDPAPSSYRAPWWLPGGHLQTVLPYFLGGPAVDLRWERWERADGDFNDLAWLDGPPDAPLVVLFHGLEGSARSHYARHLLHALKGRGWRGVVAHFRGCAGEPNRLARAYHAGDTAEIAAFLAHLHPRARPAPLYAVGVSLGGNALLKWLGEYGPRAGAYLQRAAAVSAPLDMPAAGRALDRGLNRLYAWHFLRHLKARMRQKRAAGQLGHLDLGGLWSLRAFDERVTAPLHGFLGADDYWQRSAAKPWLKHIAVPTLILNARNDPFLPAEALPGPEAVSPQVTLEYPAAGGHVGFLTGPFPGRLDWLPRRLIGYFATGR
jgi:predicted alpha/beta-fold hydrolase